VTESDDVSGFQSSCCEMFVDLFPAIHRLFTEVGTRLLLIFRVSVPLSCKTCDRIEVLAPRSMSKCPIEKQLNSENTYPYVKYDNVREGQD
jgi:hypothetical protein